MSSPPEHIAQRRVRIRPFAAVLLVAVLAFAGLLVPGLTPAADAASLSNFNPGNIISNGVFFNKSSMTQAQIQTFLDGKVKTCAAGATCLKSYKTSTRTIAGGDMCPGTYKGASGETAAAIISKVAQACGINPQVFLVMLQKEQTLVTSTKPTAYQYNYAMGANCPDTTGCNGKSAGFFTQVYSAAWQLKRYANPPGSTGTMFTWYPVGKTSKIAYSPRSSMDPGAPCGYESVTIANQATADLYYYTPYVPNAAALRAGYGTGDACSAYGNRNFYLYFSDWFGSTQIQSFITAPTPTITGTARVAQILTAHAGSWSPAATKITYQWLRDGVAVSGATGSTYKVTGYDARKTLSVRVTASRLYYQTIAKTSAATAPVVAVPTTRVPGSDAYQRSVAASRLAHPGTVSTVYVVSTSAQQDSLSAAALASAQGAGYLLLPKSSMLGSAAAELKRLAPTTVVLVGSTQTLDAGTTARIKAVLPNVSVTRITGTDQYVRSLAVAERFTTAPTVYLATGRAWPDGITAAATAGGEKAPLLVVDGTASKASPALIARLKALKTTRVIAVGGTLAVSSGFASSLSTVGIAVTRYSGASLWDTNIAVMAARFTSAPRVVFAPSSAFADGPAAAALAGALHEPLVLNGATCVGSSTASFLLSRSTTAVTLVGGVAELGPNVVQLRRC